MVAVAILGILAVVAAPQMQAQIIASRVTGTTNELIAELGRARSDAIRTNQAVTINPTTTLANRGASSAEIVGNPAGLTTSIVFNPNGTTTNTGTITISAGGSSRVIQVLGSGKAFVTN